MQGGRWRTVIQGLWRDPESIHRLENRASFLAIRHSCRRMRAFGRRVLLLGGSMSVVLAQSKGRA
eukprot:10537438-Lingulodinium_polyedra.AAC.1